MRKQPLGPVDFIRAHSTTSSALENRFDKGHFIGHALGGLLHINLFPQSREINRGWSELGKLYRKMEQYCEKNTGTYCFSRPIYGGYSAHPSVIEFGALKERRALLGKSISKLRQYRRAKEDRATLSREDCGERSGRVTSNPVTLLKSFRGIGPHPK
jgi:hypothetical protein